MDSSLADMSDVAESKAAQVLGPQPIFSNKGLLITPMNMPVQSLRMDPVWEVERKGGDKYSRSRLELSLAVRAGTGERVCLVTVDE